MNLFRYLGRKKNSNLPYAIGGMFEILAFVIVMVFALSLTGGWMLRTGNSAFAAVISSVLVDLANTDRSAASIGGLKVNEKLVAAAQAKANDMAAKGYFAHLSPDGRNSWSWFKQVGYSFSYAGENLAVDFSDSVNVEQAWMNSPAHRANILNGHFTEIGIATAVGTFEGRTTTFVVQMFGTPMPVDKFADIRSQVSPKNPTELATATTESSSSTQTSTTSPVLGASVTDLPPQAPSVSDSSKNLTEIGMSWFDILIASPETMLRFAYYLIAVLLLGIVVYITRFEMRRHHLHHIVAASLLMVLMLGLFTVASFAFFVEPTLAATL